MKKPKTPRQNWFKILDKLAAKVTYKRFRGKCVKCGADARIPHHIFSRRYISVRWDMENILNVCFPCHFHFFHSRIEEARDWIIKRMGEEKYNRLKMRALGKTYKPDYELIRLDLNSQLEKIIEEYGISDL